MHITAQWIIYTLKCDFFNRKDSDAVGNLLPVMLTIDDAINTEMSTGYNDHLTSDWP